MDTKRLLRPLARVACCMFLLLAACGHEEQRPKVRIGLNPWPGYLDLAVAEHEGIFAAHGFNVAIVEYSSLHDMARAYQLGQIDFMPCTLVEVLEVHQGRRPVEVIWVADASSGADVVLARGIENVDGLQKKKVAYEPNSLGIYILARMLDFAGLRMQDVEPIGMDQAEMVRGMREGQIAAAITYPPASLQIREITGVRPIFTTADLPREVIDVYSVDPAILDADPTFLPRFYAAMVATEQFARANPEAAIAHKCKHMGIERSAWDDANAGIEQFGSKDQREWIWGSDRIPKIMGRLTEVVSAACGARRAPADRFVASSRPIPDVLPADKRR